MNTKANAYIVYERVLSYDGNQQTIGGIQHYLKCLCDVLKDCDYSPIIIQFSNNDFSKTIDGISYRGYHIKGSSLDAKIKQLVSKFKKDVNQENDLIIWGSFYNSIPLPHYNTISIQHGVSFDLISNSTLNQNLIKFGLGPLIKYLQRRAALKKFSTSKHRVCVDYNFLNWYRTFSTRQDDANITVIPNFTEITDEKLEKKSNFKSVLFARRFVEKRGVELMLQAANELLSKYDDIHFTFAGEGPLEHKIASLREKHKSRIDITKYDSSDTLQFHKKFDIAVIPTIGSEGTSLSLLEAMASGCVVVCSNVGGMTNVVIDQYNGLIINPTATNIVQALSSIYNTPELGNKLRKAALSTVKNGFSRNLWIKRWANLLKNLPK